MTYYSMNEYKLVGFQKSTRKNKKYTAVLFDRRTHKIKKIHFGHTSFKHFRDTTGCKCYSHLDHNDKARRDRFHARHSHNVKTGYYSPSYFSLRFLW